VVTLLEFLFQGFFEWVYSLILEIWNFFTSSLLNVMTLDFAYIKSHIPVVTDISQVLLAVGWALLLGNLVFQALRSMASGLGFEGEDPKLLFARTFVFGFLLLASPQICEIVLNLTSKVITLLEIPDAINVHLVDSSVFGVLGASWILVIIFDVITMFMVLSLLLEVAERYMVLAMLTIMAPLAFAMGGSKSTSEIFTGWCRMFGSMCFLMATNIVFFKMLLSVASTVPSFPDVFLWMVLIVSIVKVAKKADEIITRIGLNPAITGNKSTLPGVLAYTVFRTALSMATKGAAKGIGGALGMAGKGAVGVGKGAVGLGGRAAGAAFQGAGGVAGTAGAAGAAAGVAGGIGGAVAGVAGQRSDRPRYGGGRQQNQQQEQTRPGQQTQHNTSRTQTNSQQQTTTQERTTTGYAAGPQGTIRTDRSTRKSSVPQGTQRAPSYVTPPGGQVQTEEKSTSRSSSSSSTVRGGGFSGSAALRGSGFGEGPRRGGGFSGQSRERDTSSRDGFGDGSRSGGFSSAGRSGGGFTGDGSRGGGFSSAGRSGGGFTGDGSRGGGFSSAGRSGGGFTGDGSRGGGFSSGGRNGGGFTGKGSRGGGFSRPTEKSSTTTTQENQTRSGFGSTGTSKDAPQSGGTFGGRPSGTTRSGGFSHTSRSSTAQSASQENISKTTQTSQTGTAGTRTRSSQRPAASSPRYSRNGPPSAPTPTAGTQKPGPTQQEQRRPGSPLKPQAMSTAGSPQTGTAGTQARSSQRPPATEPRHSRNGPPVTSQPSTGSQGPRPAQQEQCQAGRKDKPQMEKKGPRPGTAGTGTAPRTPPGQKLNGGPSSQNPTRQTKREGGPTSV